MENPEERLARILTDIKKVRGTLYASPNSLALDPEVEAVRRAALAYVTVECWTRIFQQVKEGDDVRD